MSQELLFDLFVLLIGLALGSFNNVLIYRLPANLSIVGRSHCTNCSAKINSWDNIPVISYILLKGQCRNCKSKISIHYPVIEATTALTVVLISQGTESHLVKLSLIIFTSFGLALALIDWLCYRLPNIITYPLFAILAITLALDSYLNNNLEQIYKALISSAASLIFFLGINLISKGGMGLGDVKLAASIGLITGYFGFIETYLAFLTSFILGSVYGLWLMFKMRAGRKSKVAFGTFLYVGAYLSLLTTAYL